MADAASWIHLGRMDELSRQDSPLHRLDPRAKILATGAYIVVVMSLPRHALAPLLPLASFPLFLLIAGRIPAADIGRKIALAAPFAVLIGLFNPLLDRTPVVLPGGGELAAGWLSFASILVRFTLTVSAALLLVATTGMMQLGAGLRRLGMPRVFNQQLQFLYRYLFVIGGEAQSMLRALACRVPRLRRIPWSAYGSFTGQWLLRSLDRAERIHRAMALRGYDGQVRCRRETAFTVRDLVFLLAWLGVFAIIRFATIWTP
ncbi:MAG TPA: cobalt ECF transporter T component CbiQ [Kiritimatiellia bacterium]|nr:cobalt ECF transporter T component CbiQ [Kiritimatiellia bacterium]HMP35637.1 cobalt ECF transporter T component CbiQ [Kiritimatiellia bacterium]